MVAYLKKLQIILVLLSAIVVSGCGEHSPYPIKESGVKPEVGSIQWMDNDRVMFSGVPRLTNNLMNPEWVGVPGIYIWNINEKTIELYRESNGPVCLHDGYIIYSDYLDIPGKINYREKYGEEARFPYWEGQMGKETLRNHSNDYLGEKPSKKIRRNPFTCRLMPAPENAKGTTILLLEDGEYIDRSGTHNGEGSYVFHSEKKGIHKELPLSLNALYAKSYAEFEDRYFFQMLIDDPMAEPCGSEKCTTVWWIDHEGNVEKILLPYFVYGHGGTFRIFPTKKGYFAYSKSKSQLRGGFFIDPDLSFKQIIKGFVDVPVVSPDGCKVAFNYVGKKQQGLRVINFCTNE